MLDGLNAYIRQQVKEPIFSEVYWASSNGGTGVLSRTFPLGEKIKGIYTNSIFFSCSAAAGVVLTDQFGRQVFENQALAGAYFAVLAPFWYYIPGNRIQFTAAPFANVRFSICYQLITEHKLNRGGQ